MAFFCHCYPAHAYRKVRPPIVRPPIEYLEIADAVLDDPNEFDVEDDD